MLFPAQAFQLCKVYELRSKGLCFVLKNFSKTNGLFDNFKVKEQF